MARGKRSKLEDLAGQPDPRAPLDGAAFLAAAQPVMKGLTEDLAARAKGSAAVAEALRKRWSAEKQAQRTADGFGAWQERLCEQVAAAWLLSCVFVRTLEDRGLLGRVRIAGQGAADAQRVFFELAPSLTERDYLLMVFRELSRLGAAAGLFDARHNPVWMLAPSAEGAKRLLGLFRTPSVEEPAFRFGQEDTRFLGDLYQDLDEGVRKRFALLQTPRFVEAFILDRTLDVALEKHGVDDVEVIDPTCGSGHFLLGSFERLFERRLRAEPGIEVRAAAAKALGAVYGADVNPYAVAIARFRLVLAFVEKGGWRRIADVPRVDVNVVVADSLLHGSSGPGGQVGFGELEGQSAEVWRGEEFALEDEEAAKKVLGRRYAAVVGNPPYITVKDKALRDKYRDIYTTCHREYSLAVPFTERFFELARAGGRVGMITANSFMKREFGKKLIEEFLPTVNLETIVNTSGAYIPGHGTPTVLLFGSNDKPQAEDVLTVLANRGEPSTPEDPEKGAVWSSIARHWEEVGFENEFVSVARTWRNKLKGHPWALAGGGAGELKELLEQRSLGRLSERARAIGFMCITKQDEVFSQPSRVFARLRVGKEWVASFVIGEQVRDWSISEQTEAFFPYEVDGTMRPIGARDPALQFLWAYKTVLEGRAVFGGTTFRQTGRCWYEYGQIPIDRISGPAITFAFVATHNHFVLDRGGKVFKQTAPIIKLPETATEDDHLALLACLNSSTACFWMKQVFFDKGSGTDKGKWQDEPARIAYEFAGTQLAEAPLPPDTHRSLLITLARQASDLAAQRESLLDRAIIHADPIPTSAAELQALLATLEAQDTKLLGRLVAIQEEIDWLLYDAFSFTKSHDLLDPKLLAAEVGIPVGLRPFEVRAARSGQTEGIDGQSLVPDLPSDWPKPLRELWERRISAIDGSRELRLIEQPLYKRRWLITPKHLAGRTLTFQDRARDALRQALKERVEALVSAELNAVSLRELTASFNTHPETVALASELDHASDPSSALQTVLDEESVPFLAPLRFTATGERKHAEWQHTWELQRAEDAGRLQSDIPVPPKYARVDFASDHHWELRGPLDVPKERFISYPHCESKESPSPLFGWAGWNHEQRARALATLYWARKTEEGWLVPKPEDPPNTPDLTPMLAGLLELLPWLHQWHAVPSDDYGGDSPASYFSAFLEGQCQELGLTHDDLRAWRPPKTRGRSSTSKAPKPPKAKASKRTTKPQPEATDSDATADASAAGEPPRKPKRTKAKAAAPTPEPTPDPEPAFTLSLAPPDDDGWKSTKKKSKKSPSRRKPSEPA